MELSIAIGGEGSPHVQGVLTVQ